MKRIRLDDGAALGTAIQTDLKMKVEGRGSVRITTMHPTTVCLGEVGGLDVENARLIYKAKVKSDPSGVAFLEMWVQFEKGPYFSRGMNNPVKGQSDWMVLQTPILFRKGQIPTKVTLYFVINGRGTVWVDDLVLSKAPLE